MAGALIQRHKQYKGIADKVTWLFLDWRIDTGLLNPQNLVFFAHFNCSYFSKGAGLHAAWSKSSFLLPQGVNISVICKRPNNLTTLAT